MFLICDPVYYHPYRVMSPWSPWKVGHKIHHDVLLIPLSHLQWLEYPCWLLVLNLNLLTRETSSKKVPYFSLHPAPVVLATKITVHLHATLMHIKPRVVELLEDLLSQIRQLGNHYPSPIPKTTICVNGSSFITCA